MRPNEYSNETDSNNGNHFERTFRFSSHLEMCVDLQYLAREYFFLDQKMLTEID